jgi:heme/copper-type cytochrome/quinol oxidase subunit 4
MPRCGSCEVCGEAELIKDRKLIRPCDCNKKVRRAGVSFSWVKPIAPIQCLFSVDDCQFFGALAPGAIHLSQNEDAGWFHEHCLTILLAQAAEDADGDSLPSVECPRCGVKFRVSYIERFVCDFAHVLRERALGHLFEVFAIALTLVMTCIALWLLVQDQQEAQDAAAHPHSAAARNFRLRHRGLSPSQAAAPGTLRVLEVGFVLTLGLVVFAVWRVTARFRRASSDITVDADSTTR